jgi:hypothetical protein
MILMSAIGMATNVLALINPKFTPAHLVNESTVVLQLKVLPEPGDKKLVFAVDSVLKGKLDSSKIEVDLTSTSYPDQAKSTAGMVRESTDKLALMFIGDSSAQEQKTYIHIDGSWIVLSEDNKAWKFDQMSIPMLSTWNGGTDMLLKWVKCILDDPNVEVPVRTGVHWADALPVGKIAGKVAGAVPVDLKGTGVPLLFVASDAGDRLFSCVYGKVEDLTAQCKLQSKSVVFAWSDFNGDGRLDLASWDGQALTIYTQGADGTFTGAAGAKGLTECLGLAALDTGTSGKPGLLVSTAGSPLLLIPGADAVPRKVFEGEWPGKKLGLARPCLLADFDGDGLPDIIQPLASGSLFYKGTGLAVFAAPVACPIAAGEVAGTACLGDWNQDGMLDVLIPGNDTCRLWENRGKGNFVDVAKLTGEMSYQVKGTAILAGVCDLNNDGRQDVLLLYPGAVPQIFFSRGYRSFGFSISMDLSRTTLLPAIAGGQVAGCVADFNGDGAQDMAVVLKNGECVLVTRASTGEDLCARAIVSPKSSSVGPVRVWAQMNNQIIGAWNITMGSAPAFLCRPDRGPLKIKWQFPGEPEQTKDVLLVNKPVNVLLESSGTKK